MSCVEQPVSCLFFALSAALNYTVYGGDAQDAFAHSPAPKVPTFVQINDAFAEWYKSCFQLTLDHRQVLPVQHALQGHPEAARHWEEHILTILKAIGFTSTTHERNIYSATFGNHKILLLRQVDDFALSTPDPAIAARIYTNIGRQLQLPGENTPPFEQQGIISSFNGVNILQTRHYTKISCPSYIHRMLAAHHWATPSLAEPKPGSCLSEPLSPSIIHELYNSIGPLEGSPEHATLAQEMGFAYQTLLGELLYAYVTARPDIGYAITTLAKFAAAPAKLHTMHASRALLSTYVKQLNGVLFFGVPSHNPPCRISPLILLNQTPLFHWFLKLTTTFSSMATWRLHTPMISASRSTTGYAFLHSGGGVAYRSKTQSLTATSSTKAEFIAALFPPAK